MHKNDSDIQEMDKLQIESRRSLQELEQLLNKPWLKSGGDGKLENCTFVSFNKMALTDSPRQLTLLSHSLLHLDLSDNRLHTLPDELSSLRHLRELNLGKNEMSQVPCVLAKLKRLEALYLLQNMIRSLPPFMSLMQGLTFLHVVENPVRKIITER